MAGLSEAKYPLSPGGEGRVRGNIILPLPLCPPLHLLERG